ncbi:hypothetical protein JCM12296A_34080 [Desulfosarcina cetonica]
MRYAGLTDPGHLREHNEDAWQVCSLTSGHMLFVVSDGVGGHAAGEIASRIVVETLPLLLDPRISRDTDVIAQKRAMEESLAALSYQVLAQTRQMPGAAGMAATAICGLLADGMLVLGHMGDSRCYRLRDGILQRLTKDHTVVQMLLDLGEIAANQLIGHPAAGRLTQAVGMDQEPLPHISAIALNPADILLFCSDGLHGMIDDEKITGILSLRQKPKNICKTLLNAALEAGGRDNITVIVVEIEKMENQ